MKHTTILVSFFFLTVSFKAQAQTTPANANTPLEGFDGRVTAFAGVDVTEKGGKVIVKEKIVNYFSSNRVPLQVGDVIQENRWCFDYAKARLGKGDSNPQARCYRKYGYRKKRQAAKAGYRPR